MRKRLLQKPLSKALRTCAPASDLLWNVKVEQAGLYPSSAFSSSYSILAASASLPLIAVGWLPSRCVRSAAVYKADKCCTLVRGLRGSRVTSVPSSAARSNHRNSHIGLFTDRSALYCQSEIAHRQFDARKVLHTAVEACSTTATG